MIAFITSALGIVFLADAGITFTTPGSTLCVPGLRMEATPSFLIPPLAGALALAGGFGLFLMKPKRKA